MNLFHHIFYCAIMSREVYINRLKGAFCLKKLRWTNLHSTPTQSSILCSRWEKEDKIGFFDFSEGEHVWRRMNLTYVLQLSSAGSQLSISRLWVVIKTLIALSISISDRERWRRKCNRCSIGSKSISSSSCCSSISLLVVVRFVVVVR